MMASRGMGAILPSKMPGAKRKARRDDTDFDEYAAGGMTVKNPANPGKPQNAGTPKGPGNLAGRFSTTPNTDLEAMYSQAQSTGDVATSRDIENEQGIRKKLKAQYAAGGKTKSKVNQAGVYTKPGMRKSLFESIKSRAVQGTGAGQWSARKAQLLAKQYKAKGGGYK